jgi:hypothetical protein
MKDKIRSPLKSPQPANLDKSLTTKSSDSSDTAASLIIADEILLIKDEIAHEAEQVLGKEVGKQQTAATACEVIKKELAVKAAKISPQP